MSQKFSLGRLVATPAALHALQESGEEVIPYVTRHANGDWGELCPEDKQVNDQALREGSRIFSAYTLKTGTQIWIITEADRSATTILLPDDY